MSTGGLILILAVLILGGVIATVGDRIGTRVGKARLSLFKLRPRRTATLVTILTGAIISASTFGILFGVSEQLRMGVFELGRIQRQLVKNRRNLQQTQVQKAQVEKELSKVRSDREAANRQLAQTRQQLTGTQKQLGETNQSLQRALAERSRAQAANAQTRLALNQTRSQLAAVSQQTQKLRSEIQQLQAERNQVIAQRNRVIAQREQEIRARDQVIAQREGQLRELEAQQEYLAREVLKLERAAQDLRQGNVAILRGQVLASAVVRIVEPTAATQAVDKLLREANRRAIQLVRPGTDGELVRITKPEVEQLIDRIDDGQDYVVRIFSAANYLVGERAIQVFADAVPNRVVFLAGDVVASTSLDFNMMTDEQVQERINLLIAASTFRARSLGILNDSVRIGRIQNLVAFIDQLKQSRQTVELKAVAADVTYTSGPLNLELIAERDGQILFRTKPSAGNGDSDNDSMNTPMDSSSP